MTALLLLGAATAFVLGARHGLDWDHLAAITDLISVPSRRGRRSLGLALWYCIGHGSVILLLGTLVGLFDVRLPAGLDRVFEVIVGLTLIALGVAVLVQIARQGRDYRFVSRWRLLSDLVRQVWMHRHRGGSWERVSPDVSRRTAFAVGVLHGTGAETPTQVVLFATAAAAGSTEGAAIVLVAFVMGLVASDLTVAFVWASGRIGSARIPFGQAALGALTGLASIGVGLAFIAEKSAALPSLLGG